MKLNKQTFFKSVLDMADHLKMEASGFNRKFDICRLQPANKHDDLECEVVALKKLKICKISKL